MSASSTPSRGLRAAAALVAALVLSGAPASAQQAAPSVEELGLEVQVGYDGRRGPAPWLPVEVVVEPSRALAGDLVVESRSSSGGQRITQAIEAAARTRKAYRFLVPAGSVSVSVREQDREPLRVRGEPRIERRTFLVGVLGQVPPDAPSVRSEPTGFAGAWVAVDPAWVELSSQALAPLAALVAGIDDLAALTDDGRRALAAAVSSGLDLVVTTTRPGPIPDLAPLDLPTTMASAGTRGLVSPEPAPGVWVLTAAQLFDTMDDTPVAVAADRGRGRVVVAGAHPGGADLGASSALWSAVTGPGPGGTGGEGWSVRTTPYRFAQVFAEQAGGAPALPWLAVFIIGYVLVVGPANGLLLARMRRRELAWVTVPIITAVFTVGAFLGAVTGRPADGASGDVRVWADGAGRHLVAAQVRTPTAGEQRVDLAGQGWLVRTLVDGGRTTTVTQRADGVRAEFDLGPLQPAGLVAERAIADEPPIELHARAGAGGVLTVTLANTGDQPLEAVALRAATATRRVGTLAPGERREVEIGGDAVRAVAPYREPTEGLGSGPPDTLEALLREEVLDQSPGLVWVVARGGDAPAVRIDGRPALDKGGLVAVGVSPDVADQPLSPFVVRRDVVVGGEGQRPSALSVEDVSEAFLRFRLPAGAPQGDLQAQLRGPAGMRIDLEVWHPERQEWLPAQATFGEGVAQTEVADPLGQIWVRASGDLYPFDYSSRTLSGVIR